MDGERFLGEWYSVDKQSGWETATLALDLADRIFGSARLYETAIKLLQTTMI
jgi:hypothetical protein